MQAAIRLVEMCDRGGMDTMKKAFNIREGWTPARTTIGLAAGMNR